MIQMRRVMPLLFLALALYFLTGVVGIGRYPRVWVDEGWVAEVGWTMAQTGHLGNPSHGSLHEYGQRVYWMPPLYFLALTPVFALAKDPLTAGRALSLFLGALELAVLFWMALRLISGTGGVQTQAAWVLWIVLAFTLDPTLWKVHRSIRFEPLTGLCLLSAVGSAAFLPPRLSWLGGAVFSALATLTHPTGVLAVPASLGTWLYRRPEKRWRLFLGACGVFVAVLIPYVAYLSQDRAFGFANFLGQNAPHVTGRSEPIAWQWLHEWTRYRNYFAWPRLVIPLIFWVLTLVVAIRRRAPWWLLWTMAILAGGFACLPNKTELYLTLIAPFLYLLAGWTGQRMAHRRAVWAGAVLWLSVLAAADLALLHRNRDCRYRDWVAPLVQSVPEHASVGGTFVTWFAFHDHPYYELHRRRAGDLADARPQIVIWGDAHTMDPIFSRLRNELGPFLAAHADTLARSASGCYGNAAVLRPHWDELDPRIAASWERFGKGDPAS
jgi:4-amino-4-deoxy-L-arabinose transferase-like glycosyltransferase